MRMSLATLQYTWIMEPMGHYQWLTVSTALVVVTLLIVRHVFLPPHMRRAPKGKRWKIPPGPAGLALFGNLLQYRHARRDEVELRNYVSCYT